MDVKHICMHLIYDLKPKFRTLALSKMITIDIWGPPWRPSSSNGTPSFSKAESRSDQPRVDLRQSY
jgi:hypothetical protein